MTERYEIAVVGGGASGMAAAIAAARLTRGVCLIEAQPRVGRKLLSTGNGRCNITNTGISPEHYRSASPDRLARVLDAVPRAEVLDFLASAGIPCFEEREGRMYPRSEQAGAVLDMLRMAMDALGVATLCDTRVDSIRGADGDFRLFAGEKVIRAKKIILACGSCASPQLGGCADGSRLARSLGHSTVAEKPALVPVPVSSPHLKALKGVRVHCAVSLIGGGKKLHTEQGEIQFNEDTLSGIAVMQLSSRIARLGGECVLSLDLIPELGEKELAAMISSRRELLPDMPLEHFLSAVLHKRAAMAVLKDAGCQPLTRTASSLTAAEISRLAALLKDWRFPVTGTGSFKAAQVMSGGVELGETGADMQSAKKRGVYLCGEMLDCDGDCGGFNLHWAWCTGIIAGRSAAEALTANDTQY